jgi:KDO2-lipid IV(A) lauroyltransferase
MDNQGGTMAKKRALWMDYAVYLLIRLIVCVVQALSWSWALGFARLLAGLAYRVDRRHRLVAIDNLRHAFPELSPAECTALVRATYEHFMMMAVEMMRLPRCLRQANVEQYFHWADPQDLQRLRDWGNTGRPLLGLTGHFGNWEVLSYIFGMGGCHGAIVARRLDNPYLDRLVADLRRKTGLKLLDKNRDYPQMLDILEQGGRLGMVGDHDAGPRGLFVEFLGRPASTFKSIALLSLQYRAPIFVLGAARVGHPLRYVIYLEDTILPEDYTDRPDAAQAITRRYTQALERLVRRVPEQYFWLHRRWKNQPPVRARRAA